MRMGVKERVPMNAITMNRRYQICPTTVEPMVSSRASGLCRSFIRARI
jgi:hypothetical protein